MGFPGASVVKNLPANAGDSGSVPGSERAPGGGNCSPLQYSCLENLMDRGGWWATVHAVAKSWRQLSTHADCTLHLDFTNFPTKLVSLFQEWIQSITLCFSCPVFLITFCFPAV